MLRQNQTPDLVARVQKPWPKWVLVLPKKWHIWAYFGTGVIMSIAASVEAMSGAEPDTHVGAPVLAACAVIMYIRTVQFYNYFYRSSNLTHSQTTPNDGINRR